MPTSRKYTSAAVSKAAAARLPSLIDEVERVYAARGRHSLPWRTTRDPYAILVSETMLQQTQVSRVIPKFESWMRQFPTPQALAHASTRDVLTAWSGLGYNRRALALKQAAQHIVEQHNGTVPKTLEALLSLPGVGQYTARAILAFAYDIGLPLIETNVRAVFIHFLFPKARRPITDKEILPLVELSLVGRSARRWYAALMDYGTELKASLGATKTKLHKKSASYVRQSKFEGSSRQLRAAILRRVLASGDAGIHTSELERLFSQSPHPVSGALESLVRDGAIEVSKGVVRA